MHDNINKLKRKNLYYVGLVLVFQQHHVFMNLNKLYIIGGASSGLGYEYEKFVQKNKVIGLYNSNKLKNSRNLNFYKINLEKKKDIILFFKKNKKNLEYFQKKIIFINFATYKKDNLLININEEDIKNIWY